MGRFELRFEIPKQKFTLEMAAGIEAGQWPLELQLHGSEAQPHYEVQPLRGLGWLGATLCPQGDPETLIDADAWELQIIWQNMMSCVQLTLRIFEMFSYVFFGLLLFSLVSAFLCISQQHFSLRWRTPVSTTTSVTGAFCAAQTVG